MTLSTLIDEARKLSPEEQADLFDELLRLVNPEDVRLTPAQAEDLDKRIDEVRSEKAVLIDGDEAIGRIQNRR